MKYYPVLLDLKDKKCSVIGSGIVAEHKIRSLIDSGALVDVISPVFCSGLKGFLKKGKIRHIRSNYRKEFIKGSFLVIAATDNNRVNLAVSRDAQQLGILTNIVDIPEVSNFIVPSVIQKDGLIIAISTGGRAPCLSKKIRIDLSRDFLPRYQGLLKLVEAVRKHLRVSFSDGASKKRILTKLVNSPKVEDYIKWVAKSVSDKIIRKIIAEL